VYVFVGSPLPPSRVRAPSALRVVECALVVVDTVAGVEVQTEKLWPEADVPTDLVGQATKAREQLGEMVAEGDCASLGSSPCSTPS
jgi:hypothetical protein